MIIALILAPICTSGILFALKNKKIGYYLAILASLTILGALLTLPFFRENIGSLLIERTAFSNVPFIGYLSIPFAIDNLSYLLLLLTSLLTFICILTSHDKSNDFLALFFLLAGFTIALFTCFNILLFYIFFEASLIPLFFIIGIWGGNERVYSAYKLFLYTLTGSMLFLGSVIYLIVTYHSTDINVLSDIVKSAPFTTQIFLFCGIFIALAIKVPMFPVHTWLPDAHVQAPTSGSIMLAGVLLKIGTYAMLRLLPLFVLPKYVSFIVIVLSVIGVIYASFLAFAQTDIKKLIAYSSIAHMGFVTAGIFAPYRIGVQGAVFQMLSHGIVSAGLFLCIGIIYDRIHTREISQFSGLAGTMPRYSLLFFILVLGAIGMPGTSGFVGEFFTIAATFVSRPISGTLLSCGVIFSAIYMLWLCKQMIWGKHKYQQLTDINARETIALCLLCGLVVFLGLYPKIVWNTYDIYNTDQYIPIVHKNYYIHSRP